MADIPATNPKQIGVPAVSWPIRNQAWENAHDYEVTTSRSNRQERQSPAASHANSSRQPNGRSRGKSPNDVTAHKDDAVANEADAGSDLGRHARRINDDFAFLENIPKPILCENEKRRRHSDERIGPRASAFLPRFALESAERREPTPKLALRSVASLDRCNRAGRSCPPHQSDERFRSLFPEHYMQKKVH